MKNAAHVFHGDRNRQYRHRRSNAAAPRGPAIPAPQPDGGREAGPPADRLIFHQAEVVAAIVKLFDGAHVVVHAANSSR